MHPLRLNYEKALVSGVIEVAERDAVYNGGKIQTEFYAFHGSISCFTFFLVEKSVAFQCNKGVCLL